MQEPSLGRLIAEVSRKHTNAQVDMHTPIRSPLSEWLACRRIRYLHNTQETREQHSCPQRDLNPRSQNQAAADLHLRRHGHRDRFLSIMVTVILVTEASCLRWSLALFVASRSEGSLTLYLTHWGREGSFKLLKRPFLGFLTILTL